MNTNNVYIAKIYRLIDTEMHGDNLFNYRKTFIPSFSRDTLVYHKSDGKFYDLLAKKYLNSSFDWASEIGTEIVNVKELIPFNEVVSQTKERLSKNKIKRLYSEHKNAV